MALKSEATRLAAAAGTLSGRPGLGWLHGPAAGGSQDTNRSESRLQTERQVRRVVGGTGLAFCVARGGAGRGVTAGRRRKPPLRARRATRHAAGTRGTVGRFLLTARRVPSPPFVSWEDEVERQPVYSALYAPWGKAVCDLRKTFLERALGVRSRGCLSPSAAWPRRDGAGVAQSAARPALLRAACSGRRAGPTGRRELRLLVETHVPPSRTWLNPRTRNGGDRRVRAALPVRPV